MDTPPLLVVCARPITCCMTFRLTFLFSHCVDRQHNRKRSRQLEASAEQAQCLAAAAAVSTAVAVRAPGCSHARCSRSCSLLRSASSPVGFIDTADASPIPTVPPNEDQVTNYNSAWYPQSETIFTWVPPFRNQCEPVKSERYPQSVIFLPLQMSTYLGTPCLYAHTFASLSKP